MTAIHFQKLNFTVGQVSSKYSDLIARELRFTELQAPTLRIWQLSPILRASLLGLWLIFAHLRSLMWCFQLSCVQKGKKTNLEILLQYKFWFSSSPFGLKCLPGEVGVSESADHTLYKKEVVDVVSSNLYRKSGNEVYSYFHIPYLPLSVLSAGALMCRI